jgi:glycosyltransferase involved in cell wall biosynthesis
MGSVRIVIDVILPVLDETGSLPWVLDRIPPGFSPLVVDNDSHDGSGEMARSLGARVIDEPVRGFGAACFSGLLNATSDVVCFMDCDRSLDPGDLPRVVAPVLAGRADLVVGARVPEQGAWPLHARIGNRLLARKVQREIGVALNDLGPMRAARREDLISLELSDRRFGWPLEMVLKAARSGLHIQEVPIPYRARHGHSKVTGTVAGTFKAIRDMRAVLR